MKPPQLFSIICYILTNVALYIPNLRPAVCYYLFSHQNQRNSVIIIHLKKDATRTLTLTNLTKRHSNYKPQLLI